MSDITPINGKDYNEDELIKAVNLLRLKNARDEVRKFENRKGFEKDHRRALVELKLVTDLLPTKEVETSLGRVRVIDETKPNKQIELENRLENNFEVKNLTEVVRQLKETGRSHTTTFSLPKGSPLGKPGTSRDTDEYGVSISHPILPTRQKAWHEVGGYDHIKTLAEAEKALAEAKESYEKLKNEHKQFMDEFNAAVERRFNNPEEVAKRGKELDAAFTQAETNFVRSEEMRKKQAALLDAKKAGESAKLVQHQKPLTPLKDAHSTPSTEAPRKSVDDNKYTPPDDNKHRGPSR